MRIEIKHLFDDSGFSMTELLMVMVVISIVAALALLQFGGSRDQFRRQNVAQQLKQAFERARFDSVKRRADGAGSPFASVNVNSTSYTLVTDLNGDGDTSDEGESVVTNLSGQTIVPGPGSSITLPATIAFDKRGEVAVANPTFLVCQGTCSVSAANNSNANIVLVTPTGTVNILPGGANVPTFSAPSQTAVSPGTGVKGDVTVP